MLLYVPCQTCGKLLRFPHELLGHTTLCPACGSQVLLSAVTAMTQPPGPAALPPQPMGLIQNPVLTDSEPLIDSGAATPSPIDPTLPPAQNATPATPVEAAPPEAAPPEASSFEAIQEKVEAPVADLQPLPAPPLPAPAFIEPSSAQQGHGVFSSAPAPAEPVHLEQAQFEAVPDQGHFDQIHLDHPQSDDDLVQWDVPATVNDPIEASPPLTVPQWSPAPLGPARFNPYATPLATTASLVAARAAELPALVSSSNGDNESRGWRTRWLAGMIGAGAVAMIALILLLVHLLGGSSSATDKWEQQNRDAILSAKESAEDLALNGRYREAIDQYSALQRLVAGHAISDPLLQQELEKAWQRRDKLFDLTLAQGPGHVQSPTTAASVSATQSAPQVAIVPPEHVPAQHDPHPTPTSTPTTVVTVVPPVTPSHVPEPFVLRRPRAKPTARVSSALTDAEIGASIKKGVDYLIAQFDGSAIAPTERERDYPHDGVGALALYSLMQCGLATHDDRIGQHSQFIKDAVETLKKSPMHNGKDTYSRALRVTALALYNRKEDQSTIVDDVDWLLRAQSNGAYTYDDQFSRTFGLRWDNSNSQYGLLGVWSAAEIGIDPVKSEDTDAVKARKIDPNQYWRDVQQHWSSCQFPDGQWGYGAMDTRGSTSMTLAGTASLFVTQDYLDSADFGDRVGRPPFSPALAKALAWLESGNNSVIDRDKNNRFGYTLYGLERVGLASGFKYFGGHDWYREQAADIVRRQESNGSWEAADGAVVDTAYVLLFLARGRHPVIMNKLRFDGDWANRPRDVANLARFASRELERPLNWQVVPISHDWHDWTDSPILYMASDTAPQLADADREKIRQYIQSGGMLLSQADGDSQEFTAFIENLGKQMFPGYQWIDLSKERPDHPLFSVFYKIASPPPMRALTNGSRILMLHLPVDQSRHWQLRDEKNARAAFELGVNIVLYGAARNELHNRLETDYIAKTATPAAASLAMAQIKYAGNDEPEPAAWQRAAQWFRRQTSLGLDLKDVVLGDLPAAQPAVAHLTGTAAFNPTDAQIASLRNYVQAGGVLVIDPAGGSGEFLQSVQEGLIPKAFPGATLDPVRPDHPLLTASGDGMEDIALKPRSFARMQAMPPDLRPKMLRFGKGTVIVFPLDFTTALLGFSPWGIAGYTSESALPMMKNLLLWTWDGARDLPAQ